MLNYLPFIPALLIFGALLDGWPYSYFQILRWGVCLVGILYALREHGQRRDGLTIVFAAVAVLFNPLAPIYLSRETWIIIDVVAGCVFTAYGIWLFRIHHA